MCCNMWTDPTQIFLLLEWWRNFKIRCPGLCHWDRAYQLLKSAVELPSLSESVSPTDPIIGVVSRHLMRRTSVSRMFSDVMSLSKTSREIVESNGRLLQVNFCTTPDRCFVLETQNDFYSIESTTLDLCRIEIGGWVRIIWLQIDLQISFRLSTFRANRPPSVDIEVGFVIIDHHRLAVDFRWSIKQ